ncbi:ArsR/SmtB family transcription factor [Oricola thermophila]|uniref:Winged helix-turn-helix transcriptional regulator n=1 Tax=Oricola thermophila TaxID=2742145 RepID=A0A6N1VHG7_9HYPH|nr:metalloregulator ArsR/SmtB family transcription factor [Oricola thermophila]QKV20406.1 winged helix-turn-helix transcriptional regulator [Oricola thermophila]
MSTSDSFFAIADPHRRYILEELRRSPRTVGELAESLPISRPAVSQHMKILLDAGMVSARSEGTRRIYMLEEAAFSPLHLWLDQFWTGA